MLKCVAEVSFGFGGFFCGYLHNLYISLLVNGKILVILAVVDRAAMNICIQAWPMMAHAHSRSYSGC
jgi:hypothetical protein